MQSPIILIDGSSYFYRAFHALPPLTNSQGQPTGAIYGVVNMVKRLIKDYSPSHLAVVFDAPGKTFRDEWYPAYKAHRPPTPVELTSQFKPLCALLHAMGIPVIMIAGVEADDVLATFAHQALEQQVSLLISTGDKDMAQLVNPYVTLINTMNQQQLNAQGVKEKFGVHPAQIIDYLALVGDSADNVPGVPQCGPKTAVKWLTEYHTLDNLLQHADLIRGKIGESLRATREQLALSKRLVTLKTDLSLPLSLHELTLQAQDTDALLSLIAPLEFKHWLRELQHTKPIRNEPLPPREELDDNALQTWLTQQPPNPLLALQLIHNEEKAVCGIELATNAHQSVYIPCNNKSVPASLKSLLQDATVKKIGYDLKSTAIQLAALDLPLNGLYADTMLEAYLLDSTAKKQDLAALIDQHLTTSTNPPTSAMLWQLHQVLSALLTAALVRVFYDIEMPLVSILANMELHGVLIDKQQLATQGARLTQQIQALESRAHTLAGHAFNLNSPKQLLQILYHELQLPILAKTPKGQPSTSESVLHTLAENYPLPAVILEHRHLSKLVSTYIEALPKHINPRSLRVHTSYNQAITSTGRLSSSDPNLQNIPVRHTEGRLIRKAFIAPEGSVLLTADYSQIELRIMAHLSADPQLLQAFQNGLDIHTATASELFSVPLTAVSSEQRRRAKAINFGLIYGMSAFGLAKQLGIDRHDAQHYIDVYFERYPGVLAYMEKTRATAHRQGYVETLFGRRLIIPNINARNHVLQKGAERMAINAPMQGTAADIIKLAMIAIADWLKTPAGATTQLIMQVHDELVFEIKQAALEPARLRIQSLMEHCVQLDIPLLVSIGVAHDWDSAH